nr:hypothetical protein [uncultured Butyrivibrio sp.]
MALYALGDLHLSFQTDKKMDMFGKVWRNHERKIEKNCNKLLTEEDTLVLVGDHSWGRNLSECEKDMKFIEDPPTSLWEKRSRFTLMAEAYGAEQVIYAHCHGKERFNDSYKGMHNGVKYSLVSGDYLDFKPQLILE